MNQSIRTLSSLIALAALSSLVACGGGGGGSSAPAPAPAPAANSVVVSTPTQSILAVGQSLTLTWSNSDNAACSGTGLLAGISAASGSVVVSLTAEGQASYSVSCGGTASQSVALTVLPQYTQINDVVFEQALVDAGIDDQVDGRVLTSKALAVTKLAILIGSGYAQAQDVAYATTGAKQITDLTGLQSFRNLVSLRLEGQGFTSIDLSSMPSLKMISLWQDPITTLDLSHNTALTTLGISETGLTQVDVSMLSQLVELDAQNAGALPYVLANGDNVQGLTSLDVSKNAKLTRVYLSYNLLSTLDLSANKSLTQLAVDHNALTSLTLGSAVQTLNTLGNAGLTTIVTHAAGLTNATCSASKSCQIDPTTVITTAP